MATRTLFLGRGYDDGYVQIKENGQNAFYVDVEPDDIIEWRIGPGSNVSSIDKIEKKQHAFPIFQSGPRSQNGVWTGQIIHARPRRKEFYDYTITWSKNGTSMPLFDPILTIKPSIEASFLDKFYGSTITRVLALVAAIFALIAGFLNWRKSRMISNLKSRAELLEKKDK